MKGEAQSPMTPSARVLVARAKRRVCLTAWCRAPRQVRHVYSQKVGRVLTAKAHGAVLYLVEYTDKTRQWCLRRHLTLVTQQTELNLQEN